MKGRLSSPGHIASGIFMILALLWLTVSTPFVYESRQMQKENAQKQSDNNPFSNTTEEKSESGAGTLSEYLHDPHHMEHLPSLIVKYHKCVPSGLYFAFHPDLISPPPEA
jgi:hypothetical protein